MTTTLPAIKTEGVDAFLNTHGGPAGEFIRFTKEAKFARLDGEEVPVGTKLIVVFPRHNTAGLNSTALASLRHGIWAECFRATCRRRAANLATATNRCGRRD